MLEASVNEIIIQGHVNRFTDLLVRDVKTSDCYRADKLLVAVRNLCELVYRREAIKGRKQNSFIRNERTQTFFA